MAYLNSPQGRRVEPAITGDDPPITPPDDTPPPVAPPPTEAAKPSPKLPGYTWLDWIDKSYGPSASRGTGFADMPTGTNLESIVNRFNTETGANARYLGGPSDDRVDFGQGATDVRTSGGQLWQDLGQGAAGRPDVPSGPSGGLKEPDGNILVSGGPDYGPRGPIYPQLPSRGRGDQPWMHYEEDPRDSQLRDLLMKRAQQGLNVDPNDPIIKGQVDAYGATQERGARNSLQRAAEAKGSYANLGAETRSANEKAAQSTGALQSQLMQNELNARRQEIQNALSEQGALLTAQQQTALTRELGLLNNQLGMFRAGTESTDVANRFKLGQMGNELGWGNLGLGYGNLGLGQRELESRNDQFGANYFRDINERDYQRDLRARGLTP